MGDKHLVPFSQTTYGVIGGEREKDESGTRGARGFSFMCCLEDAFSEVVQEAQKEGQGYFAPALIHLTRATTT